jgi:hypothetical protein
VHLPKRWKLKNVEFIWKALFYLRKLHTFLKAIAVFSRTKKKTAAALEKSSKAAAQTNRR